MNKVSFISGVLAYIAASVFFVSFFIGLGFSLGKRLISSKD